MYIFKAVMTSPAFFPFLVSFFLSHGIDHFVHFSFVVQYLDFL